VNETVPSAALKVPETKVRRPWFALTLTVSLAAHLAVAAALWVEQPPQPKAGAVMSIEIMPEAGAVRAANRGAASPARASAETAKPATRPEAKPLEKPEPPREAREAPRRSPSTSETPQPPAPNVADAPPEAESPLRRPAPPAPATPAPARAEAPKPVPPGIVVTPRDEIALRPPTEIPPASAATPSTAMPKPAAPRVLAEYRVTAVTLRRPARVPPSPTAAPKLAAPATARGTETARSPRRDTGSVPIVAADAEPAAGPESSMTPPRYGFGSAANPIPRYPEAARANGWEGVVMLSVSVAADGRAESVSIGKSSGHSLLDAAAVDAVRRWRFEPARRAGVPVAGTATVPIRFRLED
jgi:periplasmic protein TonB